MTLRTDRRIPATGTHRRLQALVAIGWSQQQLADKLGMNPHHLRSLIRDRRTVSQTRARQVAELYDELWDTPPPVTTRHERQAANRAINYARARGWPEGLMWDDDEIDDPAASIAEYQPRQAKLPNSEDLAWLVGQGLDSWDIATRYHATRGTVERLLYPHKIHP